MGYFPFFVELKGKRGLIVGGGIVAERKVRKLLPYEPELLVVAPKIDDGIWKLSEEIKEKRKRTKIRRNLFYPSGILKLQIWKKWILLLRQLRMKH